MTNHDKITPIWHITDDSDDQHTTTDHVIRPRIEEPSSQKLPFKFDILDPERVAEALNTPDLTIEGSSNAVNVVKDKVVENIGLAGFPNIFTHRQHPVVSIEDNFNILRFPANNPGRSSRYTRYVDSDHVLRTHTSAMVPEVLRMIAAGEIDPGDEITVVMPGICFRRDVTDRQHLGIFHQMDVWVIRRNDENGPFTQADLLRLADAVCEAANPGGEKILHATDHPYTTNGIEAYASFNDDSLEIFEAGLAHPEVLARCGLDPSQYSGLALGMGLDRLVMARKGMPDIRYIRSENPHIASQMEDLEPFHDISSQPAIMRDISYVVDPDTSLEDVSDHLQVAFGQDSHLIEHVAIKSTTPYDDLPENVRERLGIQPGQVNILVNFTLRHPDRTLTKKEVNQISNKAYQKLHQGSQPGYGI